MDRGLFARELDTAILAARRDRDLASRTGDPVAASLAQDRLDDHLDLAERNDVVPEAMADAV